MTIELGAPRERPTTSQPGHGPDVASGDARPLLVPPGASAAAEARRSRYAAPSTRFEDYGPTSHVSEAALFFAYRNAAVDPEDG